MIEARFLICAGLLLLAGLCPASAVAESANKASTNEVQLAVEKGLFYIEETSIRWWEKKKCVSCHEGPMMMFSHNIAKRRGFPIDQEKLDFWMEKWVLIGGKVNQRSSDKRKDGGGMLGAPLTLLYRDLDADRNPGRSESFVELTQIIGKDWQLEDGSWDIKVGLDYTPWILMALTSFEESDMPLSEEARKQIVERRTRTEKWISDTEFVMPVRTEDLAAWVVYTHRPGANEGEGTALLKELLDRRRDDGLWGVNREIEFEHQLVTGAVLFALTSIGKDTSDPVVAETRRLLLDLQQEDGRWAEGGRIFDKEGAEIENSVYNLWTTAWVCAALSQTIQLPPGTKSLFKPDPAKVREIDALAARAADGYDGKAPPPDKKMDKKMEEALSVQ